MIQFILSTSFIRPCDLYFLCTMWPRHGVTCECAPITPVLQMGGNWVVSQVDVHLNSSLSFPNSSTSISLYHLFPFSLLFLSLHSSLFRLPLSPPHPPPLLLHVSPSSHSLPSLTPPPLLPRSTIFFPPSSSLPPSPPSFFSFLTLFPIPPSLCPPSLSSLSTLHHPPVSGQCASHSKTVWWEPTSVVTAWPLCSSLAACHPALPTSCNLPPP